MSAKLVLSSSLLITLFFTNLVPIQAGWTTLVVGNKPTNASLITSHTEIVENLDANGSYHTITFTGDNESIITQVEVTQNDRDRNARISLVHGGPGFTFATIAFEIPRGWVQSKEAKYEVKLHGNRKMRNTSDSSAHVTQSSKPFEKVDNRSASSDDVTNLLEPSDTKACIRKTTCHECIQTPHCAWCLKPDFEFDRCFLPQVNLTISENCANHTFNPSNEFIKITHEEIEEEISIKKGREEGDDYTAGGHVTSKTNYITDTSSGSKIHANSKRGAVQLYPQEISLKLRKNVKQKITIQYTQKEDYPVDLYYLMDLSNSMKDKKLKLSNLAELLVQSMSNITSNFRFGFGSFVEKVVKPNFSTVPKEALQKPCDGCAVPYEFKNHVQLTRRTSDIIEAVRNTSIFNNSDAPEVGFDAIMQAIVCRDHIGWRDNARKLLLFSTDAGFHLAGDGKLTGIVKPNDGFCHLNNAGEYDTSVVQDYPSIAQINTKVKENFVNIIWAVTEDQLSIYESLAEHIEGSTTAKLGEDSSNIVELVREQYNAISSTIELRDTSSSYISIKYFSTCLGGPRLQTKKCEGLKVGDKVEFEAEILLNACPQDRSEWVQNFTIQPSGISESLSVNLEMICDCQCENPLDESFVPKSPMCNHRGDLKCGNCACHENFFGESCECVSDGTSNVEYDPHPCRNGNSTIICSGRGICECNQCTCNKREDPSEIFYGKYCECSNFYCDRAGGVLCSGNGICGCDGRCICNEGWVDSVCGCSTDKSTCINPNTGEICSDNGVCECGRCNCPSDHSFEGEFCEVDRRNKNYRRSQEVFKYSR